MSPALLPSSASVAEAFSAAAPGYDEAALLQREVARRLAERVVAAAPAGPRVLEVGCGTGFLSRLLMDAIPDGRWLLTDIAPAMLDQARLQVPEDRAEFMLMDGECPDAEGPFDLIVSSLAVQWFGDLGAGLKRLTDRLAPGGRLMLATLGEGTFPEWREAHAALSLPCGARRFVGSRDFPWPEGGTASLSEDLIIVHHADGRDFARSLRAVGAHLPAPGHTPLSPGEFRRVLRALGEPCAATYHVLYGCWRKP